MDNILAQVDRTHGALRTSLRPNELGPLGGAFHISVVSGQMAAGLAAASPILSFRWATPGMLALIRRITLSAACDATAFAPGAAIFDAIRARGFTVADTGGGAIAFTGAASAQAKSSRFPASALGSLGGIRASSTATLTAGTRTLDANPFGSLIGCVGAVPAGILVPPPGILFDAMGPGAQPLELSTNEGFVIRATVPATGTWFFGIDIDWDEVDQTTWLGG